MVSLLTSLIKITRIKHPEQMLASAPAPPKAHHAEGLFRSLVYEARCQWPLKYGDGNGFNPGPVDGWGGGGQENTSCPKCLRGRGGGRDRVPHTTGTRARPSAPMSLGRNTAEAVCECA